MEYAELIVIHGINGIYGICVHLHYRDPLHLFLERAASQPYPESLCQVGVELKAMRKRIHEDPCAATILPRRLIFWRLPLNASSTSVLLVARICSLRSAPRPNKRPVSASGGTRHTHVGCVICLGIHNEQTITPFWTAIQITI